MDGYVRVSRVSGREGESFISPDEQRRKIKGWAQLRDVEILDWGEDFDKSGNRRSRPALDKILARVEAGETEGIVVAKLDRLSRMGTQDALKLVEHIVSIGGSFAAIDLGVDPTTPTGEMMLTLMLALAHMQWRELSDGWQAAKSRAIGRGVKIGGANMGYEKTEDGTLIPTQEAELIREIYRLAGRGSINPVVALLKERRPDRVWTATTVRRLLASRAYLGEVSYGSLLNTNAHEPLVTRSEWEAAQQPSDLRRAASEGYPLSGLATCAGCGEPLVGSKSGDVRVYRCKYTRSRNREQCDQPAVITAERLESYAKKVLKRAWLTDGWRVSDVAPEGSADAQAALEEAEAELYAFAEDTTLRKALGDGKYHELLEVRTEAVTAAQESFRAQAQQSARETRVLPQELLDTSDPQELRELLSAAFSEIQVTRGRGKVSDRVKLLLYGSDVPVSAPENA